MITNGMAKKEGSKNLFSMEDVTVCCSFCKHNFLDWAKDGNSISFINKSLTKSVVGSLKGINSKKLDA